MQRVYPIPAFNDNYIWLLDNGDGSAQVVDPGDAAPVIEALEARGLSLAGILITHHHFDHVGGVEVLKERYSCPVYGPDNPAIAGIDTVLREGDHVSVGAYSFAILETPGHTLDHIAYFQAAATDSGRPSPLLFCGDTLFAAGCGRIFEGDPPMMHASLHKLAGLPANTLVYCTHEYTLANLAFARAADPQNEALRERENAATELRAEDLPTLPSTLSLELATNPFLRSADPALQANLLSTGRLGDSGSDVDSFAALRAWKDTF